jgi:hypothetical protein
MPKLISNLTELDPEDQRARGNALLDTMIAELNLKNDAALSRALDQSPPVISKIRHGRLPIGDTIIISLHELSDWPVKRIKEALGRRCLKSFHYNSAR